jgi:hypothetical protein
MPAAPAIRKPLADATTPGIARHGGQGTDELTSSPHAGRRGRADTPVEPAIRRNGNGVWAMWILGVIALFVMLAVAGAALGQVWGPLLLAVGFAGWGVLLLVSGFGYPLQMIGVGYLLVGVLEFAAAWEFWLPAPAGGPSSSWRVGAALTGVAGALGVFGLLMAIAGAMVSAMII